MVPTPVVATRGNPIRNWCFTMYRDAPPPNLSTVKSFRYMVYQKEICPDTGLEHWQGYVELTRGVRMDDIKKLLADTAAHVEPRKGTQEQAREYCMKTDSAVAGTMVEHGVFEKEPGKRNDLVDYAKEVQSGKRDWELALSHPSTFMRFSKHTRELRAAVKPQLREPPKVHIRYGPTGTGKTRYIYDNHPIEDIFHMEAGYKWFDAYEGQSIVLFDEYMCNFTMSMLLQLLDRYPMRVPVKGSFVNWNPTTIYITSNFAPEQWYPNCSPASHAALKRRITSVTQIGLTTVEDVDPDEILTL